jgi:RNA polymerase sigma-70 factor (ECF subfamily)
LAVLRTGESLSIAFLVLLERLTPIERAVFLLREVFDYEYSEIGSMLGQSEVNCRQILRRARQHVRAERPRFKASPAEHDQLIQRFLLAVSSGDLHALEAMLSADAVLHSDGGGKAPALPKVIEGAAAVARAIAAGVRQAQNQGAGLVRIMQVNGEPAIITYRGGRPFSVVVLQSTGGRLEALYVVTNPEKLSHLPAAPS